MLLRQFKNTGPLTILLIVIIVIALWASPFVKIGNQLSLYFDINAMPLYGLLSSLIGTNPLPGVILSLLLVSLMAFLVVNLNTTLFFINERTFLPALFYLLLGGLFPQYQILNPAIFAAVFLMLAIRRIMEAYRVQGTAYNFFDAGILIATGSLFYANLLWFGLIVITGIALLRTGNLKEIVLALLGLATPYILICGFYYVAGKSVPDLFSVIGYNLFTLHTQYVFTPLTIVTVLFAGALTVLGISHVFMLFNTKKIQSRKTFSLLLWIFMISVAVYLFVSSASVEIIWIAGIPGCYFLSHYFVFNRRKVLPEILFAGLLFLILVNQLVFLI
jgi:hypothetical protein